MGKMAVVISVLLTLPGLSATYYVATDGADTNNGTAAGTPFAHHPWDALATNTADGTTLGPGDTVYMKKGQVWYDCSLLIEDSGTNGNPITTTTLDGFGSGANPILCGGYNPSVLSWTADGSAYKATGIAANPNVVVYNGTGYAWQILTQNDGATSAVAAGEWDWDADGGNNSLWVNVGEDPDDGTAYVSKRNYVVLSLGGSYATFRYLDIRLAHHSSGALYIYTPASNVIADDCTFSMSSNGVQFREVTACSLTDCIIQNNTSSGCLLNTVTSCTVSGNSVLCTGTEVRGINIQGSSSVSVLNDTVTGASDYGIYLSGSSSNTVCGNVVRDCWNGLVYGSGGSGYGVFLTGASNGNIITRNWLEGNYTQCQIETTGGTGGNVVCSNVVVNSSDGDCVNGINVNGSQSAADVIVNNTVYHNPSDHDATAAVLYTGHGIAFQGNAQRGVCKNNVIYVARSGDGCANNNGLAIDSTGTNIVAIDTNYNCLAGVAGAHLGALNLSNYDTLAAWTAVLVEDDAISGADANSISGDPLFRNTAVGDFHLLADSPCRNTGTNLGVTYQLDYDSRNQNNYGSGWEIGAFAHPELSFGVQ